jgi:hypothetical protein
MPNFGLLLQMETENIPICMLTEHVCTSPKRYGKFFEFCVFHYFPHFQVSAMVG